MFQSICAVVLLMFVYGALRCMRRHSHDFVWGVHFSPQKSWTFLVVALKILAKRTK